jgi:hypothetical protein
VVVHGRPTIGRLRKVRDRKYGRTFVAIYGPGDGSDDENEAGEGV